MNSIKTNAIVLSRIDYGEADRIITVLTPDQGKLSMIVKGARKLKSKLAGGIELFSINEVTFIKGRGEVNTLVSARMSKNFSNIIKDIERVQTGYDFLKKMNKNTEPDVSEEYFKVLEVALVSLNDENINLELTGLWFDAQLLSLAGHTPNLTHDLAGKKLEQDRVYIFDFDSMGFQKNENGKYSNKEIKLLRLLFAVNNPVLLKNIFDINKFIEPATQIIKYTANSYLA